LTRARWVGIAVLVAVLLFVVYAVKGVTDAFSHASRELLAVVDREDAERAPRQSK
jgi:hypothetical protein